jgi:hypothetical protein
MVLDQARSLAEAGIGIVDLVTSFGGLPVDEERAMIRRLAALLPKIHSL